MQTLGLQHLIAVHTLLLYGSLLALSGAPPALAEWIADDISAPLHKNGSGVAEWDQASGVIRVWRRC